MVYRKLKSELLGLNYSEIPADKIKIEGEYYEGDILINEKGMIVIYRKGGIYLFTNDAMHYVTEEDLKGTFKSNNICKDE